MIRVAVARVLHALANRLDPEPTVTYVYVPYTTAPTYQWYGATGSATSN